MSTNQYNSGMTKLIYPIGGAILFIWFICGGIGEAYRHNFDSLSALFSGLAFVGVLGTLFYQRNEIILQRQDLEETRKVLKETAEANKETAESQKVQLALVKKNMQLQARLAELNKELKIAEIKHPMNRSELTKEEIGELNGIVCEIKTIAGITDNNGSLPLDKH